MDISDYQNLTGLSGQVMLNVQRVLACLEMQKNEVDTKYLSLVSKASYSKSLVMAMNAQSEWRPGNAV